MVYNCTNGRNPLTWDDFRLLISKYIVEYPTKYVIGYPTISYRTNTIVHRLYSNLFSHLPAALLDIYLKLTGNRAM